MYIPFINYLVMMKSVLKLFKISFTLNWPSLLKNEPVPYIYTYFPFYLYSALRAYHSRDALETL